jgi:hypothetical protein
MERKKKTKKGGPGKKEAAVTSGPGKETTNYFPDQEGAIQEEIRKHEEEAKENEPPKDQSIIQFSDQEFYALSFQAYRNSLERYGSEKLSFLTILFRSSQLALPICKGYLNSGNTCFVNCVIQSILSLPRMIRSILMTLDLHHPLQQISSCLQRNLYFTFPNPSLSLHLVDPFSSFIWLIHRSPLDSLEVPTASQSRDSKTGSFLGCGAMHLPVLDRISRAHRRDLSPRHIPNVTLPLFPVFSLLTFVSSSSLLLICRASSSQADAMEFFTYLLDRLHEEMLSGQEALEVPFNRDDEFSVPCVGAEEEWEEVGRAGAVNHVDQVSRKNAVMLNNSTIISSIFHGTLRSEVKYPNKKATSISFQRFHCLSLDLTLPSPSTPSLDLQTAMDAYFTEEVRFLSFLLIIISQLQ